MGKKFAFTLAEALLTLMLIGVVAAITLPFLYDSIRNIRLTTAFKNIYAETYSALTNIAINEDCGNSLTCTKLLKGASQEESTIAFGDEFVKFGMSASKICGTTNDTCFSYNVRNGLNGNTSKTIKETLNGTINFDKPYTFVSTRGTSFALYSFGLSCFNDSENAALVQQYRDQYTLVIADEDISKNPMNNICGVIIIDVNGQSSPNQWGRDVFGLWITDNKKLDLVPFGNKNDAKIRNCTESDSLGCAAKIMNAGWEMKY